MQECGNNETERELSLEATKTFLEGQDNDKEQGAKTPKTPVLRKVIGEDQIAVLAFVVHKNIRIRKKWKA